MKVVAPFLLVLLLCTTQGQSADDSNRLAGEKLYRKHCASCHGDIATGTNRAPSLIEFTQTASPEAIFRVIRNGRLRAGMPSWSRLPDQQIKQVITYLQTVDSR